MLYSYEEWTDPENGEVDIHQHEVTRSCYTHLQNFLGVGEHAGHSGSTVSHGMGVWWCLIYCGY